MKVVKAIPALLQKSLLDEIATKRVAFDQGRFAFNEPDISKIPLICQDPRKYR